MEEQPDFEPRSAEIVVDLACRGAVKVIRGLGLDHEFVIDDHVEPLHPELFPFVRDANGELPRDPVATSDQFTLHGHHVEVLQKSEAKGVVDVEERADHRVREALFEEFVAGHPRR
jgi:hypothetical protein